MGGESGLLALLTGPLQGAPFNLAAPDLLSIGAAMTLPNEGYDLDPSQLNSRSLPLSEAAREAIYSLEGECQPHVHLEAPLCCRAHLLVLQPTLPDSSTTQLQ